MSRSRVLTIALGLAVGAGLMSSAAQAQQNIQIAGSSTVLPFASIVAEEFGNSFAQFRAPVVSGGGTGGGMSQFCAGAALTTISIGNASRPITAAERTACQTNGVTQVIEVKFGYDGIVFASRIDSGSFQLTPRHVFLAQAARIPLNGQIVNNPYTRWNQIDPALPNQEIVLAIPGSNHGTREVYDLNVIDAGCLSFPEVQALAATDRTAVCRTLRTDGGRIVQISGDYTETLARLQADANVLGVFGLSFYEANRDRLRVATVNGISPSAETVLNGTYPVSRPIYFYVKGNHIGLVPGLQEFALFFLSADVSGNGSPLEAAGLIPLSAAERAQVIADIQARKSIF